MKKDNLPAHWQEDEARDQLAARTLIDVTGRCMIPGLTAPVYLSSQLYDLLFTPVDDADNWIDETDPETPCRDLAAKFSEAAVILSTAIAATERNFPVLVELPTIEGVTRGRTKTKIFAYRETWRQDGYIILLESEPDPTAFEFAELEVDSFPWDFDDDYEDV